MCNEIKHAMMPLVHNCDVIDNVQGCYGCTVWCILMFVQVHAQREEQYLKLQRMRDLLRHDKHTLIQHERQHERLVRLSVHAEQDMYA